MRIRRGLRSIALAIILAPASLLGVGAAPAAADSSTELPITWHGDIVVDGVHERVFISDPRSGSVVATDYHGTLLKQITSLPGASGLALSQDSGTLYVALRSGDAISAIDTGTLEKGAHYGTGAGTAPTHATMAGGKLWFSYGTDGNGNIGSLDLSGTTPTVTLNQSGPYDWYSAPLLASSSSTSGTLVAGAPGQSPAEVAVYDVGSSTAQGRAYRWNPGSDGSSNLRDLALTPDGRHVVLASGSPYYHHAYRTSDLSASGRYNSDAYPNAVAVASDGTVAGGISGTYEPDVHVFNQGVSTAFRTYEFSDDSGSSPYLRPGGLAWAPDASRLFALSESMYSGSENLRLRVLVDPRKAPTTLQVQAPETVYKKQDVTLTGQLASTAPFADGTTVEVARSDASTGGEAVVIGNAEVAADGAFSFTDQPEEKGEFQYTVRYAGDANHTAAADSVTVQVQ